MWCRINWIWLAAGLLAACTPSRYAPAEYQPRRKDLEAFPYGAWMAMQYRAGDSTLFTAEGELLGFRDEYVFLVGREGPYVLPQDSVAAAHLWIFQKETGKYAVWTAIGSAASLSHGFLFLLTGSAWLTVGLTAIITEDSRRDELDLARHRWDRIRTYARYPQGIPEDLDLSAVRMQPVLVRPGEAAPQAGTKANE
ncbi:MAG: hypothetical protein NW241_20500 [Bacteroidia bacterium]|nr:hypothetical protein [Bacteroidia bacterium]